MSDKLKDLPRPALEDVLEQIAMAASKNMYNNEGAKVAAQLANALALCVIAQELAEINASLKTKF